MKPSKYIFIPILLVSISSLSIIGQESIPPSDLMKIKSLLSEPRPDPFKRPYIYKEEPSLAKKINPINVLFGTTLYMYQNIISRHISSRCLYDPVCSDFSKDAVRKFGLIEGSLLSADRLSRCNRFSAAELKNQQKDSLTGKYPDPVSKYHKASVHNARKPQQ